MYERSMRQDNVAGSLERRLGERTVIRVLL